MNFSICSLQMRNLLTNSPVFQSTFQNKFSSIKFSNFHFSHSFTNFFVSQQTNLNFNLQRSSFCSYLKSVISFNKLAIVQQVFNRGLPNIYDTSISCRDCIFQNCQEKYKGSAISSSSLLILINCLFEQCRSNIGGAIFSQGRTDITSCTFSECTSFIEAGCVCFSNAPRIKIQNTLSQLCSSPKTSTFEIDAKIAHISYLNLTLCNTEGSYGIISFHNCEAKNRNIIFYQLYSNADCAGIYMSKNQLITFVSTVFLQIQTEGKSLDAGTALFAKDMKNDTHFYFSSFMGIRYNRGSVFYVINPNSFHIFIYKSCFSSIMEEFNQPFIVFDNSTNLFHNDCQTFMPIYIARKIGYQKPIWKKKSIFKRLNTNWLFDILKMIVPPVFFVSLIFVIVAFTILTRIPAKKTKTKKSRRKMIV